MCRSRRFRLLKVIRFDQIPGNFIPAALRKLFVGCLEWNQLYAGMALDKVQESKAAALQRAAKVGGDENGGEVGGAEDLSATPRN